MEVKHINGVSTSYSSSVASCSNNNNLKQPSKSANRASLLKSKDSHTLSDLNGINISFITPTRT